MDISWDLALPMSDGGMLRANVYRPRGGDPVPVIATMGPYGKDLPTSVTYPALSAQLQSDRPDLFRETSGRYLVWEVPDPERWVRHGYAVVHIDARGTGRSPGRWAPFSRQEATDFADAVEWLAGQSWSSGKVGVLGVSFHAMAAWRVAEQQPEHLRAIIPWYGAGDVYREAFRHGGILSNSFIDAWWYRWVHNQHGSPDGLGSPWSGESATGPETLGWGALEDLRAALPALVREHHHLDAWKADFAVDWSKVTVPFLSVGNWSSVGLHLRGNIEAFRHAASPDKWLILLDAPGTGVARFLDDRGLHLQRRFFDHYLKGADNGWPDRQRVSCELTDHDGSITVRQSASWPLAETRWTRLHLDVARRTMGAHVCTSLQARTSGRAPRASASPVLPSTGEPRSSGRSPSTSSSPRWRRISTSSPPSAHSTPPVMARVRPPAVGSGSRTGSPMRPRPPPGPLSTPTGGPLPSYPGSATSSMSRCGRRPSSFPQGDACR